MTRPATASTGARSRSLVRRLFLLANLLLRALWLYAKKLLRDRALSEPRAAAAFAEDAVRFATRYVAVASREKGALIKLGQVASLRVDVFPEAVSDELSALQDRVEPRSFDEIRVQIERELAAPIEKFFRSFEREPLAAASLGQVHRATLSEGREVAVKVLYPGIEQTVRLDLLVARIALWLFNFVTISDLRLVYREIRDSLLREMDYQQEASAAEEIARDIAADAELRDRIRVPGIHWPLVTRRVLTMEYIAGATLRAHVDAQAVPAAGVPIVYWIVRAFLYMMFERGFFHCDPHPGNLLIDSEGRIAIIDFGMHKRLTPQVRDGLRRNVWATMRRDATLYAESLFEAGMVGAADRPAVERLAAVMFDPAYYNLTPKEFAGLDFGDYLKRVRSELKELRSFHLPEGVVMWFRSFSLLLTLGAELAPGQRPVDILGPHMPRFLAREARSPA
ncbi:MAG: AarF/ABC1/UbiB kinase family protein [Myxococcales bacterium]|nr:AarF/ABC1/UbiB kinase family protein [Myxococcales bacterium]